MAYVVINGEVHDGSAVYRPGDRLPEGVGDDAMVAAGAIAAVADEPKAAPRRKAVK